MKKIAIIMITVFLNGAFFSCTPDGVAESITEQACCDGGEHIPPPPPKGD